MKRPCLDCSRLTDRPDHRCTACALQFNRPRNQRRDAKRGTAAQRGYDARHAATRAKLLPQSYGQLCPRCGQPMLQGQALDLGHTIPLRVDRTSRADRIEHADCNRRSRN